MNFAMKQTPMVLWGMSMARKQLVAAKAGDIQLAGFTLGRTGVLIDGKPTREEWDQAMEAVQCASSASMWWIGDMLNYGYATWGEASFDGKYSQQTLYQAKWVAEKVPISRRLETLSFGHHDAIASLPAREQKRWLSKAEKQGLSVSALRKATADFRASEEIKERPLPRGTFNLIYADPPWRYDFSVSDSRKIENQYPTMEVDAICGLEVSSIAAPDCVLFLWATSPKLPEAFDVIEAWEFTYKTCMVWRKDKIGMGYYARQQHELLLIAAKGSPPVSPEDARPSSVVDAPRGEHSRKPDVFYEIIERMYPKSKRVELFCRTPRPGWKTWGNEVPGE